MQKIIKVFEHPTWRVTHLIMSFIDDKTPQKGFFKNIIPQKTLDL